MIFDPLLKYAVEHENVSQRLIDICNLPKTTWSSEEAYGYYLEFQHAAESGSGFAMCMCARFCYTGWGVPISGQAAIEWGERAAKKSFAPGYFEIGYCYENGVDVEADLSKAQDLFEKSATAGYGYAATYLAAKYHDGSLTTRDIDKAWSYAQLGYKLRDSTAPLLLAGWYENGDGTPESFKDALLWYERASELGEFLASERLRKAYKHGELGLAVDEVKAQRYLDLFESQTP